MTRRYSKYEWRPGEREKASERGRKAAEKLNSDPARLSEFAKMASRRMKAIHAAARLAATLPVREHRILTAEDTLKLGTEPVSVIIGEREYPSLRQAAQANGVCIATIHKWLEKGKAELR